MTITLTERAAAEVMRTQTDQAPGESTFLRIGVAAGGCSGFSYDLYFDENFNDEADTKSEQHGVTVVVDKKSALYLDGTTLDYLEDLNRRGFFFDNPNAQKSCGCGSSFQV